MRCVTCGRDTPRKYIAGRRGQCGHEFAFLKYAGERFRDGEFQSAIARVSSQDTVWFGPEHLYYELCRRLRRTHLLPKLHRFAPLAVSDFRMNWARWVQVKGTPTRAYAREDLLWSSSGAPAEEELANYSFDRVVVCDRSRTVDCLLRNGFHVDQRCPVLSYDEYPLGVFEVVMPMLMRNDRLKVFALHDASVDGVHLAEGLRTSRRWFADAVRDRRAMVVDVGLHVRQAKRYRGMYLKPDQQAGHLGPGPSGDEGRWLSRYALEVAVMRPAALMRGMRSVVARVCERVDEPREGADDAFWYLSGDDEAPEHLDDGVDTDLVDESG